LPQLTPSQLRTLATNSLAYIKHVQVLNITLVSIDDNKITLRLPYQPMLIGNPDTGALHSGVITTLMDTTCGMATLCSKEMAATLCPTLDLRIDHLASAPAGDAIYATANVYKVTKRVVFVEGYAYCYSSAEPIARATANFVRLKDLDTGHLLNKDANP
jgi:uncharacterized protein (TIGR00369 family)